MSSSYILVIGTNPETVSGFCERLQFLEIKHDAIISEGTSLAANALKCTTVILVSNHAQECAKLLISTEIDRSSVTLLALIDIPPTPEQHLSLSKKVTKISDLTAKFSDLKKTLDELPASPKKKTFKRRKSPSIQSLEGRSRAINDIKRMINQVAKSDATALILGESGTGKEIVARMIHRASERAHKPFVPVNCGAIPAELLESELFGHVKGAFTGAISERVGRFELARGGTLFLDEIGDMNFDMQVKLLRVLQERTFEQVGSNKTQDTDVRIVAATHQNLETHMEEGKFREDLFYRLNVFPIEMPALRDRKEDIAPLIQSMVSRLSNERGGYILSPTVMKVLENYSWPGNVRELSNLVERLRILFPSNSVEVKDLPEKYRGSLLGSTDTVDMSPSVSIPTTDPIDLLVEGFDLKAHLNEIEHALIRQALNESEGVVARAAKLLNLRRTTLVEKLRKLNVQREESMS